VTPLEDNQRALSAELERVARALEAHADGHAPPAEGERVPAPALEALVQALGLSSFERDVLLLCAGVELEGGFASLCASASGAAGLGRPTFSLALACLTDPHWSALAPVAPLRRWRLVELDPGESAVVSPLRLDERVLHYLTGVDYLDERLAGLVAPVDPPTTLPPSQAALAERIAALFAAPPAGPTPAAVVTGVDAESRRAVAAAACARLGLPLHAIASNDLPGDPAERAALARLWEREAILGAGGLVIEVDEQSQVDSAPTVTAFADAVGVLLLISAREQLALRRRPAVHVEARRPTASEQLGLWRDALGPRAAELNGSVDALASQFDLGAQAIASAAIQALVEDGEALPGALWDACRAHARPRLDDLAQRIEAVAGWDDLVLPTDQLETLRELAAQVRNRAQVCDEWGFASKSARGLGVSALFEGPSGTGKTMAAEVLAGELRLDLYRIDLSQVVSKYIGETEKNLRRVFDAADSGSAILLFDEADALFGKRSEVKDSHDRYANIEVSYLLQRVEAYRGLAILTTNSKDALDAAFLRRIRFIVRFPFPDEAERAQIWREIFPAATPTNGLAPDALARLSVSGGSIRNIALYAAFLAADAGQPVGMRHVARAAVRECAKLELPLTDDDVRGWQ
jgi:hypothetical protein